MHNILVVSNDEPFLQSLEEEFAKYSGQYKLFAEKDVKRALQISKDEAIDFVSVALNLPHLDGMPFLSMLHRVKPRIPIVVITPEESTQMGDVFLKLGVRQVLIEPVSPERLLESIQEVLFLKTQQGQLQGISIVNFLQLIEMEKKTYLLEVRGQSGAKGLFYFRDGDMFDALCGEQNGEAAALEMITWDNVEIRFRTPPTKKVHRRINKSLMSLLMDGALLKDEREDRVVAMERGSESPADPDAAENMEWPAPELEDRPAGAMAQNPEPAANFEPGAAPPGEEMLQDIYELRGVKAVSLLDDSGKVLGALGAWLGSDPYKLAESVFMVRSGAMRMVNDLDLVPIKTLTLESNDTVIMNVPLGAHQVVILASDSKTLGIIRQKALKLSRVFGRLQQ